MGFNLILETEPNGKYGLTATQIIRKSIESISQTITALGNDVRDQSIEAGCNQLIPKPIDFDALHPLIEKYIVN